MQTSFRLLSGKNGPFSANLLDTSYPVVQYNTPRHACGSELLCRSNLEDDN